MSLISTHFYLPVYQTHSKLVQKPRWSKVTYSYGASYSTNWGNVSEPLYTMIGSQGETPFSLRQGKMFSARTSNFATLTQPFQRFCAIFRLSKAPQTLLHALYCHRRQIYIVAAAINAEDGHHILSSLPTGMGNTLPMIVTSCLLPPGVLSFF